ncbi:MAG TPA: 50S ribosomal protein L32 [Candidatus Kapabacteria bacterium]|nr:50S ribosomal protein L32 [Candidatus Kapabacteria bacterium]
MGLPSKKRTPRSKRERAAHFALTKTSTTVCSACGAPVLPHRACRSCGAYRGKQTVNVAKRTERARRKATHKA